MLNPKQMRELIVKKKIEEKQKELKVNKSAEFLVPLDRAKIWLTLLLYAVCLSYHVILLSLPFNFPV